MRCYAKLFTMALAVWNLASPAHAGAMKNKYPRKQGGGGRCKPDISILELVVCASGDSGYDKNKKDFDILRDLTVAGNLVDAVGGLDDVTVFIPNDKAFDRLARKLGRKGSYNEDKIIQYLAETLTGALGLSLEEVIQAVILYHVGTEVLTFSDLKKKVTITTAQGGTIKSRLSAKGKRVKLVDNEPDLTNPRIDDKYRDLKTSQGIVHVIKHVLIPVDVP